MGCPSDQRTPWGTPWHGYTTESLTYPLGSHTAPHLRHGVSYEVHGVSHGATHGVHCSMRYPMGPRGIGHGLIGPMG